MAGRNLLLVEGSDDEHVVTHLCLHHGVPEFEIASQGGIKRLIESFPIRLKQSDLDALGVLVDADTDLQARWRALRQHLVRAGYPKVPKLPKPAGTICQAPVDTLLPRLGIWLMPDNKTKGTLEDFLRFLVPAGSPLLAHVQQSVDGIPPGERRFSALAQPKAIIHTWLAWQAEPGKPLGTAITAKYLDASVPQVADFISWLRQLFFP
ncbi:MAG: hypothetical protein HC897_04225 [Thermoanaerobaculia bacterium]|nr:hypothetical protein [Thermoanaerobaculia bacterium]